jgi:predicted methyltransferase
MAPKAISRLISRALTLLGAMFLAAMVHADAADPFDAAVAHSGRSEKDLKRDPIDHPADILRLTGIKSGMRVADVLAGDGYYSELSSYLVGPTGKVFLINNTAFDQWSDNLPARLSGNRLPNVEHRTVELNHMNLQSGSFDAVLLIKVYHDLYWVDSEGHWPKIDVNAVLEQLVRALKPGGALLLVDHSAKAGTGSGDASRLHRIDEEFAVKDFEAHGLKVVAKSDLLRRPDDARDQLTYQGPMVGKTDRFVVLFRKPAR